MPFSHDNVTWTTVSGGSGPIVFNGPSALEKPVFQAMPGSGVVCRYVRVQPITFRGTLISARVEVYGIAASAATVATPGPYAWSDYNVSLQMMSRDRGASGIAFRVLDSYNYYELKLFKGQRWNAHTTPGIEITLQGVTVASGCNAPFACLVDDNAATEVVTTATGKPFFKFDIRQFTVLSNVTVNVKTNALTNAQVRTNVVCALYRSLSSHLISSHLIPSHFTRVICSL